MLQTSISKHRMTNSCVRDNAFRYCRAGRRGGGQKVCQTWVCFTKQFVLVWQPSSGQQCIIARTTSLPTIWQQIDLSDNLGLARCCLLFKIVIVTLSFKGFVMRFLVSTLSLTVNKCLILNIYYQFIMIFCICFSIAENMSLSEYLLH